MNHETSSSPMFRVGRNMSPSDLGAMQQKDLAKGVSNEWERVLWSKTAPNFQQPVEEARPFGRREKTPTLMKWLRVFWVRRWSRKQGEQFRHELQRSRERIRDYLTVAQFAIHLTVNSEKKPEARLARRRALMERWRIAYQKVLGS